MKQLERDKVELQGQLRDLEWRLDNESKVGWHFILSLYLDRLIIAPYY